MPSDSLQTWCTSGTMLFSTLTRRELLSCHLSETEWLRNVDGMIDVFYNCSCDRALSSVSLAINVASSAISGSTADVLPLLFLWQLLMCSITDTNNCADQVSKCCVPMQMQVCDDGGPRVAAASFIVREIWYMMRQSYDRCYVGHICANVRTVVWRSDMRPPAFASCNTEPAVTWNHVSTVYLGGLAYSVITQVTSRNKGCHKRCNLA